MKTYIDKKKGNLCVMGYEPVVEAHSQAKVAKAAAEEQAEKTEESLLSSVWEVLAGLARTGIDGMDLTGFLGWKSSRVHLLRAEGEPGTVVTIPSHGAMGNFKGISDVALLAKVAEAPEELRGCLTTAVKPVDPDAPAPGSRTVTLQGSLAAWFIENMIKSENKPNGPIPSDHTEMKISTVPEPSTIITVAPRSFIGLVQMGAEGNGMARKLLAAGFKRWLIKDKAE